MRALYLRKLLYKQILYYLYYFFIIIIICKGGPDNVFHLIMAGVFSSDGETKQSATGSFPLDVIFGL